MAILNFSLLIICLSFGQVQQRDIVVIGYAANAKSGAIVISKKDSMMYYVDELAAWKENTIGKLVKVSGKLLIENRKASNKNEPIKQEIVGTKRSILKPKWEFVE